MIALRGSLDHLVGATACGFRLERVLWGSADESQWLAGEALVTLGRPTGRADLAAELALEAEGVMPLLAVGALAEDAPGVPLEAVAEARPPGTPAAEPLGDAAAACALGAAAAGIVAAADLTFGALRPEVVWRDGDAVTLAPRGPMLWERRAPSSLGVVPASPDLFASPEQLRTGAAAEPADDVFALAAAVVWWATGEPPYPGAGDAQVRAALAGELRPLPAGPLGDLVAPGLAPREARASLRELREALTRGP